ncbi:MAG: AI-2E family transporter [Gemmatimonadales bacterium]
MAVTRTVRFELAPRSIVVLLATIVAAWVAYRLWIVWLVLIIALILAGTFNPLITWMEARGIPRIRALILLFFALSAVAALLLLLTVPPLVDQLTRTLQDAPAIRLRLIAFLSERSLTSPFADMVRRAKFDETTAAAATFVMGNSTMIARAVGYGATAVVLSFYMLADADREERVLYSIVPRAHHVHLAHILRKLEAIVGGYVRGQLITSAVIGVFCLLLFLVAGVPNALLLALFAALVDVLPFIGGLLVIVPAVLSALPRGLPVAGAVLVALLLYMEFESRILVPRVYGRVLRLTSTVVIIALLIGGTLLGIIGALLALPIAAGLLMILQELHLDMPGDDVADAHTHTNAAKT